VLSREEPVSSNGGSPSRDLALGSLGELRTVPELERAGALAAGAGSRIDGSDGETTELTGGRSESSVVTAAAEPQFLQGAATVAGVV